MICHLLSFCLLSRYRTMWGRTLRNSVAGKDAGPWRTVWRRVSCSSTLRDDLDCVTPLRFVNVISPFWPILVVNSVKSQQHRTSHFRSFCVTLSWRNRSGANLNKAFQNFFLYALLTAGKENGLTWKNREGGTGREQLWGKPHAFKD